jgi:streptogramin lyase
MALALSAAATATLAGCADGPCHKMRQPDLANQQAAPAAGAAASALGAAALAATNTLASPSSSSSTLPMPSSMTSPTASSASSATVLVARADGSVQCDSKKGQSVTEMEKRFGNIKVFSRDKRTDGLMHIQICGSPTGKINVYEISQSDLERAEALGFKKFEPR